jgi:ribosomal-protein-alanine N-acetyltransferase
VPGSPRERCVIRRAERRDLRRILGIERVSFGSDAWDRALFENFLASSRDLFLVAEAGGRLQGYLITIDTGSRAELASIATAPYDRRHGIGSALMMHTLGRLRRRRIDEWWLMVRTTNEEAIRFYRKFGFRPTRRVKSYYEDGADAWRMRLVVGGSR